MAIPYAWVSTPTSVWAGPSPTFPHSQLVHPRRGIQAQPHLPGAAKAGRDFVVLEEVIEEIEAQYRQFKALTGREPDYFEGHAVASANFFKGLEIVAQHHGLPYFAMGRPGEAVIFRHTRVYAYMPRDFKAYEADPFTGVQDAVAHAHEGACD